MSRFVYYNCQPSRAGTVAQRLRLRSSTNDSGKRALTTRYHSVVDSVVFLLYPTAPTGSLFWIYNKRASSMDCFWL